MDRVSTMPRAIWLGARELTTWRTPYATALLAQVCAPGAASWMTLKSQPYAVDIAVAKQPSKSPSSSTFTPPMSSCWPKVSVGHRKGWGHPKSRAAHALDRLVPHAQKISPREGWVNGVNRQAS